MFVFHKPVLSLARPNFLTGAIIETRFQASLLAPPEKNKPWVNHEPRSAHGRAVKKNKPRAEHEPHSAHGHAVKKEKQNKPRVNHCSVTLSSCVADMSNTF